MAQDATIISASLNDSELKNSIDNLVRYVDEGTRKMSQSMTNAVEEMKKTLQSLANTKIDMGSTSDGGSSKRTKKQQDETQAVNNTSVSYDRLADSMQRASQYSDEILKKSKAIRESSEWIKTGHYTSGDTVFYDKDRANVSKRERSQLLSLEEQIEAALLQQEETRRMSTQESARQAQAEQQVAQAASGTQQIYQSIYEMQLRSNEEARKGGIKNTSFANYEDFRQALAGVLGLQKNEVILANEETDAYNKLRATLGQLETAYYNLSAAERKSDNGKALVASIQEVQRAMQKIRAQAARPVSLESIIGINGKGGLSEKTLDDIAYKMQKLQSYRSGLDVTAQRNEINQVNQSYDRLKTKMDEVMAKSSKMAYINNALVRSFNYMKNRLAFYFTVGASTALLKHLIDVRSQYELTERSLGILVNSASRGTRIFNELSQMALVSPYTLIELSNAARQLTAYGVAAKDVVDTTRRLADISAAVGAPVERIAYALGHVQSYGYLTSLQARQFANSGIPLVKELANRYSELEGRMVTSADVYDRMKKKQVEYADVMAVVNKMTDEGGRFYDFQAKQAETLRVRLSNLNLAYNNMLNDIGKSQGGFMNATIKGIAVIFKHWRELGRVIGTVASAVGAYRTITLLASLTTKNAIGSSAVGAWFSLAKGIRNAKDAAALFSLTLKSIPFTAWFTAIATAISWFFLFNRSGEDLKQELDEIRNAFAGVRNEIADLYSTAINTDNIGTQLTKLNDILELAQSELGVTIPINLEDVNESNIKQKIKEAKKFIDDYIDFSQTFSEEAAGSKLNESMNEFGVNARRIYTNIFESVNSVTTALQELSDKGNASKHDLEILNELIAGKGEYESKVEYLQRLVKLYEELGIIGKKETTTPIGSPYPIDNFFILQKEQDKALDRLNIKNKEVFSNMLNDVQGYYASSSIAQWQFEQQVIRVAKKIDINNIPVEQRTLKLSAAINEEASLNNWNQFEKEFARQVANKTFGTTIAISDESKRETEKELSDWQKRIQSWCDQHGITINLGFKTEEGEVDYANKQLQEYKNKLDEVGVQKRKLNVGTGSKEAVKEAEEAAKAQLLIAKAAGADLSSLNKGNKKDSVLETLKMEISLVEKLQGDYEKLTKAGASSKDALKAIHNAYGSTIDLLNKNLQGFGLPRLDLSMITGKNPNEQLNYFKELKSLLESKGLANLERIKALDAVIEKLNVKAETYNLDMVTKGLNNELGKLKEEYELGVEFDANPELGDVFADMIGIDKSELAALPRSYEEFIANAQEKINKLFADNNIKLDFNLQDNLNMSKFDEWVKNSGQEVDSKLVGELNKYVSEANKIRLNETKKQIEEWDKLLSKYAEYEYKKLQIEKDYQREMEVARKKGADDDIKRAIQNNRDREMAKVNFEQFQQTPTWVTATGDLATMTNDALNILIDRIEEYKRTAKDLDPKQITEINKALRRLRTEQRKDSPFAIIANAVDEAKERFDDYQVQIDQAGARIDELNAKLQRESYLTESETNELTDLIGKTRKWRKEQEEVGEISAKTIVQGISNIIGAATQAGNAIADMLGAFGDKQGQEDMKAMMGAFDKAAQFAQIGASFGGGVGAVIGGVAGFFTGMVTGLIDILSGNREITKKIEALDRNISRLDITMKNLEFDANNAYGAMVEGMRKAVVESKRLQLAETERQLQLALSRKAKNRDEDEIISLQSKVSDLRREVVEGTQDIVNELLGISNAGDGITQLVQSMIEAFKNGEDAMEAFGEKWDEMIDNMILKLIVTEYMQRGWDKIMEILRQKEDEFLSKAANDKAYAQTVLENMGSLSLDEQKKYLSDLLGINTIVDPSKVISDEFVESYINSMKSLLENSTSALDDASLEYDKWALEYMTTEGRDFMQQWAQGLYESLPDWYTFGQDSEKQLSNLQQGIQGVTETTANALEAYMNGVSQQVYLHSDLLTQIRDTLVGFDMDVQNATQAQILLQLQVGNQTISAMRTMMENWQTPSGNGIRVEML